MPKVPYNDKNKNKIALLVNQLKQSLKNPIIKEQIQIC